MVTKSVLYLLASCDSLVIISCLNLLVCHFLSFCHAFLAVDSWRQFLRRLPISFFSSLFMILWSNRHFWRILRMTLMENKTRRWGLRYTDDTGEIFETVCLTVVCLSLVGVLLRIPEIAFFRCEEVFVMKGKEKCQPQDVWHFISKDAYYFFL